MEKDSWDKWLKGDTSRVRDLCSKESFTYFDFQFPERFEDHATLCKFLAAVDGNLSGEGGMKNPRVQFGPSKDVGVVTYQFFAKTNVLDCAYNVVQVYQKERDGLWRSIHSTYCFIQPMTRDWSHYPARNLDSLKI